LTLEAKNTVGRNTRGANHAPKVDTAFLEAQAKVLGTLRARLARRTEKVESDLARAEGSSEPELGQQAPRANDEVLSALSDEGRDQLELVDEALARLAGGSYGACSACGGAIAKSRLEALPYAGTCVGCAARRPHRS
jgi:RNA polymerase-binding transcription factor DksA